MFALFSGFLPFHVSGFDSIFYYCFLYLNCSTCLHLGHFVFLALLFTFWMLRGAAASKGLSSASIHFAAPTSSLRCLHYYYFVSLVPTLTIVSQVDRISWNHFMGLIMAMRFDGSDCRVPPPNQASFSLK